MKAGIALGLVVTLSTSGCSWIFVEPLRPNDSRGPYVTCTTNRAAPVIDTIFTLTNVGSAIYVAGQDNVANKGTAVTLGLSVATLWLLSAVYGYTKTSECEEAIGGDRPPSRYPPPAPIRRPATAQPPPQPLPPPTVAPAPAPAPTQQPDGSFVTPAAPAGTPPAAPPRQQQQDEDDPNQARRPRNYQP